MIELFCYYLLFGVIGSFVAGFYKKDWLYTISVLWPAILLFILVAACVVILIIPFWLFNQAGGLFAK